MGRYRIVPELSRVWLEASSSVHPIHSRTDGLEGFLELGDDLASLTGGHLALPVDKLASGNPLQDREMKRRIDARNHPTIDGTLTSAEAKGGGRWAVTGDITFKGMTNTYTDEMTLTQGDGATVKLEGESTFDIRDFGMQPPRILMLRVHPEVTVRVEIVAEPA